MKTRLTNTLRWSMVGEIVLPLVIALIFLAFTFSYYPFREKLQFDTDEGLNLMRSMLVTLGHPLYLEVSSDQPPLFTQILGLLFRFTGFEVNPARLLVLLFSTLLVWSAAQFLQLVSGKLAAILFLPLALIIPRYLELSISVMIGVPSIALAVLSMLFVTLWHQKKSNLWLVLSGFTLALSVLTKLFTGTLAPFFLIGIVASVYFSEQANGISWKTLRPAWMWGIWFAGTGILLGLLLVGPQNVGAIILPHITASNEGVFHGVQNTINTFLQAAVPVNNPGRYRYIDLHLQSKMADVISAVLGYLFLYLVHFSFTGLLPSPTHDHDPGRDIGSRGRWRRSPFSYPPQTDL